MSIAMNHTNHTNSSEFRESVPDKQCSWCARDTVNVVYFIVQVVLTITAMVWVNLFLKRKERRDEKKRLVQERRREKERLEREEREKIADIVSTEYIRIENSGILERIRKAKIHFETECTLFWKLKNVKITGLDVLRYMCHHDNYERCKTKELEELHKDLDAIVRLFQSFRIKLPPKGKCPENITEELGPQISELGEMTVPFVTGRKRDTILKVLEYFNCKLLVLKERKIEAYIPYIKDHLRFGDPDAGHAQHEGYANTKFKLTYPCTQPWKKELSTLSGGEFYLQNTEMLEEGMNVVADCIQQLSTHGRIFARYASPSREILNVYVLNAVRLFYYLICKTNGSSIPSGQEFLELIDKMKRIPIGITDGLVQKGRCERDISAIQGHLKMLLKQSKLLEEQSTADILEKTCEDLRELIANHVQR